MNKSIPHYSQGVCGDGAAILKDGARMTVDEIVSELNDRTELIHDGNQIDEDTLIFETDRHVSAQQMLDIKETIEKKLPEKRILVLCGGLRLSKAPQLNRIETMLATLIDALAGDDEEEEQDVDLSGNVVRERDTTEML